MKEPQVYMSGDAVEQSDVLSFQEEMDSKLAEYEEHLLTKLRGDFEEGGETSNRFFEKKKENLENAYIDRVCEASEKDFEKWSTRTLNRVVWGLLDRDRSKAEDKKLRTVFTLYMMAQEEREEI